MIKYSVCEFNEVYGWSDINEFDSLNAAFEDMDNMIFRDNLKKDNCCVWAYVYDDEDDIVDYYPVDRKGKKI